MRSSICKIMAVLHTSWGCMDVETLGCNDISKRTYHIRLIGLVFFAKFSNFPYSFIFFFIVLPYFIYFPSIWFVILSIYILFFSFFLISLYLFSVTLPFHFFRICSFPLSAYHTDLFIYYLFLSLLYSSSFTAFSINISYLVRFYIFPCSPLCVK